MIQRDRDIALCVRSRQSLHMWLITGPFESETLGDETSESKTTLLFLIVSHCFCQRLNS